MIIPDVNILLHAHNQGSRDHEVARDWWADLLSSKTAVGIPWLVCLGFLRISTMPRIVANPLAVEDSIDVVEGWLKRRYVRVLEGSSLHHELVFDLLRREGVAGNLTTDAHIAALAMEYGAEVATTDNDFARFPKVRWFNPCRPSRQRAPDGRD